MGDGWLLLTAALLVLPLSWCNAAPGAPTATPAPVPTDDPDAERPAAPTVAPGVDEDGVVSAVDLAAAH